jgi:hypothetical protein
MSLQSNISTRNPYLRDYSACQFQPPFYISDIVVCWNVYPGIVGMSNASINAVAGRISGEHQQEAYTGRPSITGVSEEDELLKIFCAMGTPSERS